MRALCLAGGGIGGVILRFLRHHFQEEPARTIIGDMLDLPPVTVAFFALCRWIPRSIGPCTQSAAAYYVQYFRMQRTNGCNEMHGCKLGTPADEHTLWKPWRCKASFQFITLMEILPERFWCRNPCTPLNPERKSQDRNGISKRV